MPHQMIRAGKGEMHCPYPGASHIHLKFLIKGFNAFYILSSLQSTSLWDCTGFFKFLSPYFLHLSSTTIYTRVPSLNDVTCHLLHPMVLWHLAHWLMIFGASAFLIQLYDIQLEQPTPFIYHSSFQDSSRRQITLICVTFFPSSFPFQELWGSFHLSEF